MDTVVLEVFGAFVHGGTIQCRGGDTVANYDKLELAASWPLEVDLPCAMWRHTYKEQICYCAKFRGSMILF